MKASLIMRRIWDLQVPSFPKSLSLPLNAKGGDNLLKESAG